MPDADRIEKRILLRAPRSRVWRALTDAGELGTWFRVALDGVFAVAERVTGRVTYPGYEHLTFEVLGERKVAESTLSFRWHPHAVDRAKDDSREPTTLAEFRIGETAGGTLAHGRRVGLRPPAR